MPGCSVLSTTGRPTRIVFSTTPPAAPGLARSSESKENDPQKVWCILEFRCTLVLSEKVYGYETSDYIPNRGILGGLKSNRISRPIPVG
jgi:hypothetical protein